jgi:glycolate dehydrogenase FAD-linked subunit
MTADLPSPPPALLTRMKAIVGAANVRHDTADRVVYSYDASVHRGLEALAVAYPATTQQVAALVRLARAEGVPVIARGAGTGINGGALPQKPALVIALSLMNRVLEVDPDNRLVVVEPGVVNQDLKAHLARLGFGFNYVPDPGSQVVSTIGGNVGNNAGGMHCLKYGVTSNHVLGVEVVLPDGDVVQLGGPVPGRPGMDLTGLMVGSEGTLGIVTKAWVRILPLQESVVTQLALFPTVEHAANAVSGIMAAGILPAALELLDKKTMDTVDRHVHVGYPKSAGASLIIEMDGLADGMDLELRRVREVCQANEAIEIQTAQSEDEAGRLWLSRRAAYGSMARLSHTVYVMDVTVPRNLLAEAIRRVVAICDERSLDVVTVAHAGDGNLHPLIPFDGNDARARAAALEAHHRIMEMCVEMGGSITGEHGVGVEKQNELELMYAGDDLRMMFAVKEALDPDDLLNPRKIFPVRLFDARDAARAGQAAAGAAGPRAPAGERP